ncbi:MAG: chorismate mutase [Paludibacteraceae bacterium]|nr:chorismate mutase [Paludibacteraceae bacterium]
MKDLQVLRAEIDQLDEQLWEIIGKRADVVRQVGEWKHLHGEQVVQPERWQQVIEHCLAQGKQYGLSEELIREVMEALHKESVRVES